MDKTFLQLAFVLTLASFVGFFIHRLRLPLVMAYLLAGVAISILGLFGQYLGIYNPHTLGIFNFLPTIGIAFVLFLIGMELDMGEIRTLGRPIIVGSVSQIIITTLAGFALAGFLGFNQTESFYLGIGLAFSSTVVVIKLLLEKRDLVSLYGKLSVGILLIEDLVAILVLMAISVNPSALNLGVQSVFPLALLVVKAVGLFLLTFILSKYVLAKIFDGVAKSVELLFLTAITWCFLFTTLALISGFSVVIGAFLAGVALASSPYHLQIQGKMRPLRDFFVTLFFVYLGTQVHLTDLAGSWPAVMIFTLYALIVKPALFLLILGTFGFRKHTLFQTALNLSQISEFSLIILLLGVGNGLVAPKILSIMAAVAVVSIILSSVMITYSKKLYSLFSPMLHFFEHHTKIHFWEASDGEELEDHVVVVGAHRVGGPVVKFLKKEEIPFLVMDFNPHIVEELQKKDIRVIYGDVGDPEVLDGLSLEKAKLVISTATDMGDNEILLHECKRRKVGATIIVRALDHEHATKLKNLGADYVILPEEVSGDFLANQLKSNWPSLHFSGLE